MANPPFYISKVICTKAFLAFYFFNALRMRENDDYFNGMASMFLIMK